jgi:hypothetical protein
MRASGSEVWFGPWKCLVQMNHSIPTTLFDRFLAPDGIVLGYYGSKQRTGRLWSQLVELYKAR